MKASGGVDVLLPLKLHPFKEYWKLFPELTSTIGVVLNNHHGKDHGSLTQLHNESSIGGKFRSI